MPLNSTELSNIMASKDFPCSISLSISGFNNFLVNGLILFGIKSSNNISNKKIVDISKTTRYRFLSLPVLSFKLKNTKIIMINNNGINIKSIKESFLVFL